MIEYLAAYIRLQGYHVRSMPLSRKNEDDETEQIIAHRLYFYRDLKEGKLDSRVGTQWSISLYDLEQTVMSEENLFKMLCQDIDRSIYKLEEAISERDVSALDGLP